MMLEFKNLQDNSLSEVSRTFMFGTCRLVCCFCGELLGFGDLGKEHGLLGLCVIGFSLKITSFSV